MIRVHIKAQYLKKLNFTELRICKFATNIFSTSSQLAAVSPDLAKLCLFRLITFVLATQFNYCCLLQLTSGIVCVFKCFAKISLPCVWQGPHQQVGWLWVISYYGSNILCTFSTRPETFAAAFLPIRPWNPNKI